MALPSAVIVSLVIVLQMFREQHAKIRIRDLLLSIKLLRKQNICIAAIQMHCETEPSE